MQAVQTLMKCHIKKWHFIKVSNVFFFKYWFWVFQYKWSIMDIQYFGMELVLISTSEVVNVYFMSGSHCLMNENLSSNHDVLLLFEQESPMFLFATILSMAMTCWHFYDVYKLTPFCIEKSILRKWNLNILTAFSVRFGLESSKISKNIDHKYLFYCIYTCWVPPDRFEPPPSGLMFKQSPLDSVNANAWKNHVWSLYILMCWPCQLVCSY